MLPTLVLAAALGAPQCWDIFDSALRTSAMARHPAYVSYDERITISQDGNPLVQSMAFVDYRDDGISRVRDERFDYTPLVTRRTEPGPPEFGPYLDQRQTWLPQFQMLPTIASVRVQGGMRCTLQDTELYKGHTTYHLVFHSDREDHPSLKALWVDTASFTIWKVIVSGYVNFADGDDDGPPPLANFEVEAGYDDGFLVVNHVVWAYRRHEFQQYSDYFGEYTMSGFEFPDRLPKSYFSEIATK